MGSKKDMSETWWGQRWNQVLESFGWGSRLARGRSYARAGHVLDYRMAPGLVAARVQGSRPKPYNVTIKVKTLSGQEWDRVIEALAGRAIFAARLLAGEMPQDIEEAFTEVELSLFPAASRDLDTGCSCPDWANPCKHIAAVYYVLGRRFDADPFLLFQLRGMEREELLTALRSRRAGASTQEEGPDQAAGASGDGGLPADPELFWSAGPGLDRLELNFVPPATAAAVLKRLGPLPGWYRVEPRDRLAECYRTVSERALADLDEQ